MTQSLPSLPAALTAREELLNRIRNHLGPPGEKRALLPTLQVRELCAAILAEESLPWKDRSALYIGTSLVMLDLLQQREDLRTQWRPEAMIRVLANTISDLEEHARNVLLLHLFVGLTDDEIAECLKSEMVSEVLSQSQMLLSDRLVSAGFSLDRLHAGGIGPLGEVTHVLEEVRSGKKPMGDAVAAHYDELDRLVRVRLWAWRPAAQPGYESSTDLLHEAYLRMRNTPESAPRNRKELRSLVGKIVLSVFVDQNYRRPSYRGGGATHQEIAETSEAELTVAGSGGAALDQEEVLIHQQLLQAVSEALERIQRDHKLALRPATNSLKDKIFGALMKLQSEQPRQYQVLKMRILEEKTNSECQEALGRLSRATVKRDLAEARQFLQQELGTLTQSKEP